MSKTAILSVRIISDATKATQGFTQAETAATGFGSKLASITPGALAVGGAVITGVVAAGKALYDMGATFDEVEDTIRVGTGATGEALNGLVDVAHNVATSVPASFEDAGSVVADLNTRLGLSGDTLQTVASQYLEAGRILGEDVDISTTSQAFAAFKIEGEGVSGAMDSLFRVSQATGVGINDLAGSVQGNAVALQEMGFSFEDSIALVGSLDKAGVDADATLNAMRKGMMNLIKPGEDTGQAFQRVTGELQGYIDAGDTAAALDLASQVFGTKGAPQMIQALQSGALNMNDLMAATGATSDTILSVGEETMDAAEKWQILKNKGMEALEPLASAVFGLVGDALGGLLDWVNTLDLEPMRAAFAAASPALESVATGFASIGERIGPLISTIQDALVPVIEFLAPIVTTAVTTITGVLDGALTVIEGVFNIIKGIFTGDWSLIWTGVQQIVSGAVQMVSSYVTGMRETVISIISGAVSLIRSLWESAWTSVTSTVSSAVGTVTRVVSEIPGKARAALSTAGTALYNAGRDLIQGFINGIGAMGSALWDAARNIANNAINSIKGALGIHSPSRVFRQIGVNTAEGLILGLSEKNTAVTKAFGNLTGNLTTAPLSVKFQATPAQTAPSTQNITINVSGVLNGDDAAWQIESLLRRHDWRTGPVQIGGER